MEKIPPSAIFTENEEMDKLFKDFFEKTPLVRNRMALINPDGVSEKGRGDSAGAKKK